MLAASATYKKEETKNPSLYKRGKLRTSLAPVRCSSPMGEGINREGVTDGAQPVTPIKFILSLISCYRSYSSYACAGTDGGRASAAGVEHSNLFLGACGSFGRQHRSGGPGGRACRESPSGSSLRSCRAWGPWDPGVDAGRRSVIWSDSGQCRGKVMYGGMRVMPA